MYALALSLSVLIGVSLGFLGGGGSILTTPILIYALHIDPKSAIATSLLVVGITSIAGMAQHARVGNVEWKTGLLFGMAGMLGAYVGGRAAEFLPAIVQLTLFSLMMLATAVAMFRGRKDMGSEARPGSSLVRILGQGLLVGMLTGVVGAGGGFIVVPALALLGGLPMPKAVGTSLMVIAMNTFAGFAGHASHVVVDYHLATLVSGAAVVGSFVGSYLTRLVAPESLRKGFAGFVLVMACFVLYQQV